MIHFDTDYMEGAHPLILQRLVETNMEQTQGYGNDPHTENAKRLILNACGLNEGEGRVFFLVGGTQTNATVIDGLLDRHEGVMAAESSHINNHETGAIEATRHKVLVIPSKNGKISATDVKSYIDNFYSDDTFEHMVFPGMVYISHPTEFGTLYTLEELAALSNVCREANIPLYMDGARLGYALATDKTDVTLKDIARLCDVFYIGGTKVGALFGEAVVITNQNLLRHFYPLIKQHGALLAKGRLLGIQFETLFTDNLYLKISRHAIKMAAKLKEAMIAKGYRQYISSPTNQLFFLLPNHEIERLRQFATFELWGPLCPEETPVRFVTDWATKEDDIDNFIANL